MTVREGTSGRSARIGGGTLYDIGVYCINAARNLFRAEPTQVSAVSVNSGLARLSEIDETTAATLRFGDERVATFVTSFNAADVGSYRIVGTKGDCTSIRPTNMPRGSSTRLTVDGKTTRRSRQARPVRARTAVFLRLHPEGSEPEPSGEEGCRTSDRRGALRVGRIRQAHPDSTIRETRTSHRTAADHPARRKKPSLIKVQSASRD